MWSGQYADSRGAKRAVVAGLLTAVMCGLLYIMSLRFSGTPSLSVAILLLGRALLGGAESFIITGAVGWGLALVGSRNAKTRHSLEWARRVALSSVLIEAARLVLLWLAPGRALAATGAVLRLTLRRLGAPRHPSTKQEV